MDDFRASTEGVAAFYGLFRPWLQSKPEGAATDERIEASIASLEAVYAGVSGDAIPPAPTTWSSGAPSAADLATEYGKLYQSVVALVDPKNDAAVPSQMSRAATILRIAQ
jgi:hypothetical protein